MNELIHSNHGDTIDSHDPAQELSTPKINHILQYAKGNTTDRHPEWTVEFSIAFVVLEVIGTIGAVLIILAMARGSTFMVTYRVYLTLIAMIDIVLLFVHGGNAAIEKLTTVHTNLVYDLILQSDISCRSYHVIVGFLSMLTVWLHVALMIELFVISVFPKKLNSVSSNERAHFLTLLLLTLLLIINMNYFWTIKRQTGAESNEEPLGVNREELCYFDASFEVFETKIYPVIECAVIGVIPLCTWFGLLVFTAKKMYIQGDTRPGGLLITTSEYWMISYSLSSLYLLCHAPRIIWQLQTCVRYTLASEANPGISTLQKYHTQLLDGDPMYSLPLVVAMASRIFILVAFSKAFRRELKKVLSKLFCCCCLNKRYSITSGLGMSYRISSTPLLSTKSDSTIASKLAGYNKPYSNTAATGEKYS